jgi:hypothetical protein
MQLVPLDRYKLAWWNPSAPNELSSSMHGSVESALQQAQHLGLPYLIMESTHVGEGDYRWRVLPYGAHTLWSTGSQAYELRWVLALLLLVAGLHWIGQNQDLKKIL